MTATIQQYDESKYQEENIKSFKQFKCGNLHTQHKIKCTQCNQCIKVAQPIYSHRRK